ncbi:phosphatidylglycerol:prolipoprotein diacylglycerol transferase [Peteryoungia aggregata LMG 23059]|uniref:Phosphatidylglycerol--prolipoprotein diacylglyceryl transferase n=1 Tax=Peteryoungia aggregata LMG 23059 TaxID=1368425 RepID=A0ABU0GDR7_9HYPH|nr:prolipoprotein diacylglyceryl transferase [Peteryoungia aggregata]MDQ0423448.1 phosphatidylglycerol:prolipoprotein diacylglycerol transferase [Peteryoungia aggregata LMG 23059]
MLSVLDLFAAVSFPAIDPVAFSIGPLAVHWYGLAYVAGILIGWLLARDLLKRPHLWPNGQAPATLQQIDDFVLWVAIGVVAGGRLGYIFFYDFASVAANPLRAIEVWNGGMSFHGGFVGATLAMVFFARKHQIRLWSLFDLVASVVPLGLFFGRIANFINGELWGRPADVPWAMAFPTGGPFPRHPSQLYEAVLEGLVLLIVLQLLARAFSALRTPGRITGIFVAGYAAARIFVEFYREPDVQIGYLAGGWLTMGMVLSLPMLLVGLWISIRAGRSAPPVGG